MKKTIILFVCFLFACSCLYAQSISELKQTYDMRHFKYQPGDPYNPGLIGIASYLVPGLGQVLCKEYERGVGFMGAYIGFLCLTQYATDEQFPLNTNSSRYKYLQKLTVIGITGFIGTYVWGIVDAVQVAKLKNLQYRDIKKNTSEIQLNIQPYIDPILLQNNGYTSIGLSLKATF